MATVFISLGTNLGDRWATLQSAIDQLRDLDANLVASSAYETEPVGYLNQPSFLNAVVLIETELSPNGVLTELHRIENEHDRVRSFKNAPRTLDLDILLYDDLVDARPELTVPHPRMFARAFVLVPLLEIAAHVRDPASGRAAADFLSAIGSAGVVMAGTLK
jgi:2-amino-4-hydroxy-6-hydroxymethyldihydropteridine diphosphokinase